MRAFTLTSRAGLGLFFIQRYRFLTIDQFARVSGQTRSNASDQLRSMERASFLGHFGNTGQAGTGKTPKAYFLTRKGWELLKRESAVPPELVGSYRAVHVEAKWSPQMYHRLRTVDLMIAAEVAVRGRLNLTLVQTFLEYKRVKRDNKIEKETTDFVALPPIPANRIIPDAAFVMENITTGKRGLFFLEMDMATEQIVSHITKDSRITLFYKLSQYDRYLQGMRYSERYREFGDFPFFHTFVCDIWVTRVENIRQKIHLLPAEFSQYYRFAVLRQRQATF